MTQQEQAGERPLAEPSIADRRVEGDAMHAHLGYGRLDVCCTCRLLSYSSDLGYHERSRKIRERRPARDVGLSVSAWNLSRINNCRR